jgi:ubiquinone/menaquinone biosynthesis C-methylase UbiE
MRKLSKLYQGRFLSEGYPELESLGVEYKKARTRVSLANEILDSIGRLIDLSTGESSIVDIGCGPEAGDVKGLLDAGYDAVGVEPVEGFVEAARATLGDSTRIYQGCAESLPFPDRSKRVLLLQAVLEHVDSPILCLEEAYRVLVPDGVLYVSTTNRHRFSPLGRQGEFRTRFYNWFPNIVKECYVFQQLHYKPQLANFTSRPAVHWFT